MNTQINISENGTTTLATAGKYCDRNIDVTTNVPTYEAELAEQKAITDSIVTRTITTYFNDAVESIGVMAFRYCRNLERAEFTKITVISGYGFGDCNNLAKLIIRTPSVCQLVQTTALSGAGTQAPNGLSIYVPNNLVDSYKTATNWVNYASQIKPISELGE